jgi:hypothetical protein
MRGIAFTYGKINVGETGMKRITFTTLVLTAAYASTGYTQDKKVCDVDNFMAVLWEVDKATDANKNYATAELQLAKKKLLDRDKEGCAIHLAKASQAATAK